MSTIGGHMNQPNLKKPGYPFVDNTNVFLTQSQFNYALWSANSKIMMTHVPWTRDYKDVVKFNTDSDRDAWFKSQENVSVIIEQAVRVPREGVVVLPFNFDQVINCNYLVAEWPVPTGVTPSGSIRTKYFYFILDMQYKNANVTEVTLSLDYWTTFINDVEVNDSYLKRGHLPMTFVDVDTYLDSPMDHNEGLLTPDVNFGEATITKDEHFVSFHQNQQYVLIATNGDVTGNWTNQISGCYYGAQDGVLTNIKVFAVPVSDYVTLMNAINTNIPQFFRTIEALFILDGGFLNIGNSFSFCGVTCYEVSKADASLYDITLTKSKFDYPNKYKWITKLYTFPYACLEVTDNDGKSFEIKIEDTSSMSVKAHVSTAFPFINVQAFIKGIGGKGSNSYTIHKFSGEESVEIFKDDWNKYSWDIDVPTYAIYQKNSITDEYNRRFERIQEQNNINTGYQNTAESLSTANTNSINSINAGMTTSKASADLHKTNEYDKIGQNTENLTKTLDMQSELLTINQKYMDHQVDVQNKMLDNQYIANKALADITADVALVQTLISSVAVAATAGGAIAGAGSTVASAEAGLATSTQQASTVLADAAATEGEKIAAQQAVTQGQMAVNSAKVGLAQAQLTGVAGISNTFLNCAHPETNKAAWASGSLNESLKDAAKAANTALNGYHQGAQNDTFNEQRATSEDINIDNVVLAKHIVDNTTQLTKDNIDTVGGVSKANSNRSKSTGDSINARTKANSEEAIKNGIRQAALGANNPFASSSGNGYMDAEGLRGLDIKVKTQNKDAIQKTGDTFLRYGYEYDSNVSISTLNVMKYFTFWEFGEIWLKSNNVFEGALEVIRNIFLNGVTVWNSPDDIGAISISSNVIN